MTRDDTSAVKKVNSLQDLHRLVQSSVREPGESYQPIVLQIALAADEAPAWWSPRRDEYLREFWPTESYLAGALYSVISRNAAFQYELSGDPEGVSQASRMLASANLGKGWLNFILKVSLDLYTQDNGAFIEVIRPARARTKAGWLPAVKALDARGHPAWCAVTSAGLKPLIGTAYKLQDNPLDLPIGLAHLDAARCYRTGDPETPVVYTDLKGVTHKMAWWQVITLEDMPSSDETKNDVGFCAVTRALKLAQTLRDMVILRQEKVSGRFAGRIYLTNVGSSILNDAVEQAKTNADNRGLYRYMPPIIADTVDPSASPSVASIEMASLPEGYDEEAAMRWYIAGLAMDLGVDYGFLAPLPGGKLGTSEQAEVQERQSRGKASRLFMKALEEKFNFGGLFPRNVWFQFKEVDAREEMERDTAEARRAQTRATRIECGEITPAIARQIAVDKGDLDPSYLKLVDEHDVTPEGRPGRFYWPWGKQPATLAVQSAETKQAGLTRYHKALADYVAQLSKTYAAWVTKWAKELAAHDKSPIRIRHAVEELAYDLQAEADRLLTSAYLLGWGEVELTVDGETMVQEEAGRNAAFLIRSLAPAIEAKLMTLDDWTESAITEVLSTFNARVKQYGTPFWTLIWAGMGERAGHIETETGQAPRVRRHLDPAADHCATCPPKAKEYDSWAAMLEECGGLPADGSDDCGPGCRCWLELV